MKRPNDITTKIADIMNDEICNECDDLWMEFCCSPCGFGT